MQHCDSKCSWCAQNYWTWLKTRMAQMSVPRKKKGETISFAECAATSIRPNWPYEQCVHEFKVGDAVTYRRQKQWTVIHDAGFTGIDGKHWVKIQRGDYALHVPCSELV